MPAPSPRIARASSAKSENLMIRVDPASKGVIAKAARLRGISASDYVRQVVLAQARREVVESESRTIVLSAAEQLAFWQALNTDVKLTPRQRSLGKVMRGER